MGKRIVPVANGTAYFYNIGSPDVVTVTTAGTYYAYTGWTEEGSSTGMSFSTGTFVVEDDGRYFCEFGGSFSGTANATVDVRFYKDDSGTNLAMRRKISGGGDVGNAVCIGLLDLSAGDTVSVRFTSDGNGDTFNIFTAGFSLFRVS